MDAPARLAPEERLLLALGRLEPSGEGREQARSAIRAPSFRWDRALELASYHRVHALLARNLDEKGLRDLVPEDVRTRLLAVRMATELRNERYAHAVAAAFARLEGEKVPVLLLKGAALAATVYPPGSRVLNDMDLLIRPEDYGRVARALEEAGFRKVPEARTEREMLRDAHEASFVRRIRNETLSLDVHWRLFAPDRSTAPSLGYALPVDDILARAAPGPARALVPSREDLFVHAATQIGIDGLQAHLGRLADLDALLHKGIDGRRLVGIARAARAAGITHFALSLASALGARVPADTLRRLEAACAPCRIASEAAAAPSFPFESLRTAARVALSPLLFGRPWYRILYGLTLAVPTRGTRRIHILRVPRSAADCVLRWRVVLLAAVCGAILLAQRAAEAIGWRGFAARLRASLWHAPEAEERGGGGAETPSPSPSRGSRSTANR